jgi:Domain of unknown function (DUF4389)
VLVAPPERQNRWRTFFRIVLAVPALMLSFGLLFTLLIVALLGWWAALFTGRMPIGLRNLGVYALRYQAQLSAYGYLLLTEAYPYAGPAVGAGGADPASPAPATTDPFGGATDTFGGPGDPTLIAPERPL